MERIEHLPEKGGTDDRTTALPPRELA